MQPYGAFTLFFRWRKKSVQKKASGTATPKAAHVAMRRGLRPAVAPSGLSSASVRCAHPPEKALYCPFLKEGVRNVARRPVSEITPTFVRARAHSFPLSKRARLFPSAAYRRPRPRSWVYTYSNFAGWDASMQLGYFCNAKGQRGFKSTPAFVASHEARRRMAVYARQ